MPEARALTLQPVVAGARRAVEELSRFETDAAPLAGILADLGNGAEDEATLDDLLAPLVAAEITIDTQGVHDARQLGGPIPILQTGWRGVLLRILNPEEIETPLVFGVPTGAFAMYWDTMHGPIATLPMANGAVTSPSLLDRVEWAGSVGEAWFDAKLLGDPRLAGLPVEYRVIGLHSRDAGPRRAAVSIGIPTESPVGKRSRSWEETVRRHEESARSTELVLDLDAAPSHEVLVDVRDEDGRSCMSGITVTDRVGRVYPAPALRLAPDMPFQDHVYRATGEPIRLPAGDFQVAVTRGPEYLVTETDLHVGESAASAIVARLQRWVDPTARGYYSGDPHVHGAGCSHYSIPTQGVSPETIIRQTRGEGLAVASVLTWGPCYYSQRQFFTAESVSPPATLEHPEHQIAQGYTWDPVPTDLDGESVLRYDIEVSGFPSSHSGHPILLGLREHEYPGTTKLEDWPSWNLPVHRWARSQGAFTGYAHCGVFGMTSFGPTPGSGPEGATGLPPMLASLELPAFSGAGAIEAVVDVPLGGMDFLCGGEMAPVRELSMWYHLLNTGYRTLFLGETDFPCMYDDRVGAGRTYVRLPDPPAGRRAVESWIAGLTTEPSYFGDGRSHLFDVAVDGDTTREQSREAPTTISVSATVAAWLPLTRPAEPVRPESAPAEWQLEWARIPGTRTVPIEVVVNGIPVARQDLLADGSERQVSFDVELTRSSWVALRIMPSSHSQPIFVEVDGAPIRASRESAEWLADAVEVAWTSRHKFIRAAERDEARAAYDEARAIHLARAAECAP